MLYVVILEATVPLPFLKLLKYLVDTIVYLMLFRILFKPFGADYIRKMLHIEI